MTIPAVDSTTLNNLSPNLDIGDVADPALRLAAFQYIYTQLQAVVTELNSIPTANLQNLAVTSGKLNDLAVITGKIADLAVTTAKINDAAVTLAKMATASVGTSQLVDLSVTTAKIANAAVGVAQLSPGAQVNESVNNALIVALKADNAAMHINVMRPPAPLVAVKGDGSDETSLIQAIFNSLTEGKKVYFPLPSVEYKITSPITLNTNYITIQGSGIGSILKNYGTGSAFSIKKEFITIRDMSIRGTGGDYGVGASGLHGVELDGGRHVTFDNVDIQGHGGHGIYAKNGVWDIYVINCTIWKNILDGINSVSPSGASLDQNGNGVSILNSAIFNNGANGVNWKASGLNISGNNIEQNNGAGVLVDCTGLTNSAYGINITGNEFESNHLGQVKLVGVTGVVITGVEISGNYFFSSYAGADGATALVVTSGPASTVRNMHIGANHYEISGAKVTQRVNLGSAAASSCLVNIEDAPTAFVNMGLARLIYGLRSRTVNGMFQQKGYAYSTDFNRSDNVFAMSPKTGRFQFAAEEGEVIRRVNLYIESDCTDNYTVTLTLQSADLTTLTGLATVAFTTVTVTGGGSKLMTWDLLSTYGTYRVPKNYTHMLKVDITNPATGTTMYIHNLAYEVI